MNTYEINAFEKTINEIDYYEKKIYNLHLKNILSFLSVIEKMTQNKFIYLFNEKINNYIFEEKNYYNNKYSFVFLVDFNNWSLIKNEIIIHSNLNFNKIIEIYMNEIRNNNLSIVPYPHPYQNYIYNKHDINDSNIDNLINKLKNLKIKSSKLKIININTKKKYFSNSNKSDLNIVTDDLLDFDIN